MKATWSMLLGMLAVFAMVVAVQAEDKKEEKEVTLKGKLICGKCTLKEAKACCNVLQVKDGDKTVNYFLQDKGKAESYHKGICPPGSEKDATVVGVVGKKGKQVTVKASKVEVKD